MANHFFPVRVAVLAVIEDKGNLLLLRRYKTGWRDGLFTLVGGHADGQESLREAMARELKEEIGIEVAPDALEFLHLLHISPKVAGDEFFYNIFKVKEYQGTPIICEPNKADALEWFAKSSLPDNIIPLMKITLDKIENGETYSEYGWKDSENDIA